MKKLAILVCLCLTLVALPVLAGGVAAKPACPVSVGQDLGTILADLEAQDSYVEVFDPMQGAAYKAIDSGICCSSGCPAVAGYGSRCGSASCPTGSTCLYYRK